MMKPIFPKIPKELQTLYDALTTAENKLFRKLNKSERVIYMILCEYLRLRLLYDLSEKEAMEQGLIRG